MMMSLQPQIDRKLAAFYMFVCMYTRCIVDRFIYFCDFFWDCPLNGVLLRTRCEWEEKVVPRIPG